MINIQNFHSLVTINSKKRFTILSFIHMRPFIIYSFSYGQTLVRREKIYSQKNHLNRFSYFHSVLLYWNVNKVKCKYNGKHFPHFHICHCIHIHFVWICFVFATLFLIFYLLKYFNDSLLFCCCVKCLVSFPIQREINSSCLKKNLLKHNFCHWRYIISFNCYTVMIFVFALCCEITRAKYLPLIGSRGIVCISLLPPHTSSKPFDVNGGQVILRMDFVM